MVEAVNNFTATWTQIKTTNSLEARSSHGVSVHNKQVIVYGGESQTARMPFDKCVHALKEENKWGFVGKINEKTPKARIASA